MKSTYSIDINASPDRVFYWLDEPQRVMQWVHGLVENEDLVVTDNRVGSTFRQVYDENGREMEMTGRVTHYQAPHGLAVDIQGKAFDLTVDYELTEIGKSKTRLVQKSKISFKGLMKVMSWFMGFAIRRGQARAAGKDFNKLKLLCEGNHAHHSA